MTEYIIKVDENNERWNYVEQQYTHFFGYPITDEIVRCRDCREYNPDLYNHISCELLGRYVEPDGFCAWGECKAVNVRLKIYLVYWCNNEKYEDYYESVDKVFSTYEKAVDYIESQGYKLREKRSKWEIAHDVTRWDAIEDDGFGTVYSMWIKEMDVMK